VLYLAAIPIALIAPVAAVAIFVAVAALWIIPDRRMERALEADR
jgi:membrane protein YdbS with pleckstrin-like domain